MRSFRSLIIHPFCPKIHLPNAFDAVEILSVFCFAFRRARHGGGGFCEAHPADLCAELLYLPWAAPLGGGVSIPTALKGGDLGPTILPEKALESLLIHAGSGKDLVQGGGHADKAMIDTED